MLPHYTDWLCLIPPPHHHLVSHNPHPHSHYQPLPPQPLAEWYRGAGKESDGAAQQGSVRRRMLARNRWWLAMVLLAHPQLVQYRVRGHVHEHEHHAHSMGEVAYHYAAGIFC